MNRSRSLAKSPREVRDEKAKSERMKKKSPSRFLPKEDGQTTSETKDLFAEQVDALERTEVDADLVVKSRAKQRDDHRGEIVTSHEHGVPVEAEDRTSVCGGHNRASRRTHL